ncbi:MAG: 2Fe-2S iron-sulfur cluster-binding protein, partial [Alphaproteobacteria bacterium]|nr:2Fe-2S iron-sulfur cluster-binding protein [Alphaproteobacteria bacterium]
MTKVVFVSADKSSESEVEAQEGQTLLDVAHANDIPIEGACEGMMACSTCHVIVDPEDYPKLNAPSEEEQDMLDLVYGLRPTSRLGCQILIKEELDSLKVR